MTLRLLAVIACIVAIIFFILAAAANPFSLKDLAFGLVALTAAVGLLALEGVSLPARRP